MCIDTAVTAYWAWFLGIDKFYVGAQAFIYGCFITHVSTSLALASYSVWLWSQFSVRPRPQHLASLFFGLRLVMVFLMLVVDACWAAIARTTRVWKTRSVWHGVCHYVDSECFIIGLKTPVVAVLVYSYQLQRLSLFRLLVVPCVCYTHSCLLSKVRLLF